jgi:hypothetical protein
MTQSIHTEACEVLDVPLRNIPPSKHVLQQKIDQRTEAFLDNGGSVTDLGKAYDDPNDRRVRVNYGNYYDH